MNAKKLLALTLILSVAPLALADGGPIDHDVTVTVDNKREKTNLDDADLDRDVTVFQDSDAHSLVVTVPGVEYTKQSGDGTGNNAALANAKTADGYAGLTVEGDVDLTLNDNLNGAGVRVNAVQGNAVVLADGVTVTGGGSDSTSNAFGVYASAKNGGSACVLIGEDGVTVGSVSRAQAIAMEAKGGTVDVGVWGDVYAATNGLTGNIAYGAKMEADSTGVANLTVTGSVTAAGSAHSAGLWIIGADGSKATALIEGDVDSEGHGLTLEGSSSAENTVVIGGTLSGDTDAIYLKNNDAAENTNVYVWAIENPMEKPEEAPQAGTADAALNDVYENNVHYIIKFADEAQADQVNLDGAQNYVVSEEDGIAFDYANEDNVITLTGKENRKIASVFNGEERVALEKDAQGNYFLVIPRGGGVYLTINFRALESQIKAKSEDGKAEMVIVSTRRFAFAMDDIAEFVNFQVADGKVTFTNAEGVEMTLEILEDGSGVLTYQLANGETVEMIFTAKDVTRLLAM